MDNGKENCPSCLGSGAVWLPVGRVYAACDCTKPAMPFPCAPAIAAAIPAEKADCPLISAEMERAAADVLNRRLAERKGLHGVAREMLGAAFSVMLEKGVADVE